MPQQNLKFHLEKLNAPDKLSDIRACIRQKKSRCNPGSDVVWYYSVVVESAATIGLSLSTISRISLFV